MSRKDVWVSSSEELRAAVVSLPREVVESVRIPLPYYIHLERADPWSEAAKRGDGFVFTILLSDLLAYEGPDLHIQFDVEQKKKGRGGLPREDTPKPSVMIMLDATHSSAMFVLPFRLTFSDVHVDVQFTQGGDVVVGQSSHHTPRLTIASAQRSTETPAHYHSAMFSDGRQRAGLHVQRGRVHVPCEFLFVQHGGFLIFEECDVTVYRPPVQARKDIGEVLPQGLRAAFSVGPLGIQDNVPRSVDYDATFTCTRSTIQLSLTSPSLLPATTTRDKEQSAQLELCYFQTLSALVAFCDTEEEQPRRRRCRGTFEESSVLSCHGLIPWVVLASGNNVEVHAASSSILCCGAQGALSTNDGALTQLHTCCVLSSLHDVNGSVGTTKSLASVPNSEVCIVGARSGEDQAHVDRLRVELLPLWYAHLIKSQTTLPTVGGPLSSGAASRFCALRCDGPGSRSVVESSSIFCDLKPVDRSAYFEEHDVPGHMRAGVVVERGATVELVEVLIHSMSTCVTVNASDPHRVPLEGVVRGGDGGGGSVPLEMTTSLVTTRCTLRCVPPYQATNEDSLRIHGCMQDTDRTNNVSAVGHVDGVGASWSSEGDTIESSWVAPQAVRAYNGAALKWKGTTVSRCQRKGIFLDILCSATMQQVCLCAALPRQTVPTHDGGELAYLMGGRYPTTIGFEALSSMRLSLVDVEVRDFEVGFLCGTKTSTSPTVDAVAIGTTTANKGGDRTFERCTVSYTAAELAPECCFAFMGGFGGSAELRACSVSASCGLPPATEPTEGDDGDEGTALTLVGGVCRNWIRVEGGAVVTAIMNNSTVGVVKGMAKPQHLTTFVQVATVGGNQSALTMHGDGDTCFYVSRCGTTDSDSDACGGIYAYDGASVDISHVTFAMRQSPSNKPVRDTQEEAPGSCGVMLVDAARADLRWVTSTGLDIGFSTSSAVDAVGVCTARCPPGPCAVIPRATSITSVTSCVANACRTPYVFGAHEGFVTVSDCRVAPMSSAGASSSSFVSAALGNAFVVVAPSFGDRHMKDREPSGVDAPLTRADFIEL